MTFVKYNTVIAFQILPGLSFVKVVVVHIGKTLIMFHPSNWSDCCYGSQNRGPSHYTGPQFFTGNSQYYDPRAATRIPQQPYFGGSDWNPCLTPDLGHSSNELYSHRVTQMTHSFHERVLQTSQMVPVPYQEQYDSNQIQVNCRIEQWLGSGHRITKGLSVTLINDYRHTPVVTQVGTGCHTHSSVFRSNRLSVAIEA